MCGKNWCTPEGNRFMRGSPPRVREEPKGMDAPRRFHRITPACAGRTPIDDNFQLGIGDHPRVCGKNQKGSSTEKLKGGSPPRVREELLHIFFKDIFVQDHPRVCGKNQNQNANS